MQFANKCWRIVRINGDGSIKLVLHNDNINNVSNPCSSVNNSDEGAFAHFNNKYTGYLATNSSYNNNEDNAYVGFMYGTVGSSDYASTHANINKSIVLTKLETWYTNNLVDYESYLADTIWCNDKGIRQTELGYGANRTTYSAYMRIYVYKNPSLICPNDNNGGKLSKFTVDDTTNGNGNLTYKVGLLTADEIAFSGSIYNVNNNTTYLNENTGGTGSWSMSPGGFFSNMAGMWVVYSSGSLVNYNAGNPHGIRASISLVSSNTVTGSGTSEDPYIVN